MLLCMTEFNTEDELLEDDLDDPSVSDNAPDEDTKPEPSVEDVTEGVVWTRGENGKLYKV